MLSPVDDLVARIAQLERELETEVNRVRDGWRYRLEAGRIRFERDVQLAHKRVKQRIPRFLRESSPLNMLTAPLMVVVPIAIVDVAASISAYVFRFTASRGFAAERISSSTVSISRT